VKIEIRGDRDVIELLEVIAPREAASLVRATVRAVAAEVRDDARAAVPVKSGTLSKAIMVRGRRTKRGLIRADVSVTRGKGARHDAFYWRFLEYGTVHIPEMAIFRRAAEAFRPNLVPVFRAQFGRKLEAVLKRKAKTNGV